MAADEAEGDRPPPPRTLQHARTGAIARSDSNDMKGTSLQGVPSRVLDGHSELFLQSSFSFAV